MYIIHGTKWLFVCWCASNKLLNSHSVSCPISSQVHNNMLSHLWFITSSDSRNYVVNNLIQLLTICLLLVCYVPNIANRSIYYEISVRRSVYWGPTKDLHLITYYYYLGKFQMAISPWGVVRSTSCLVLRSGFSGRRIESRYFRFR